MTTMFSSRLFTTKNMCNVNFFGLHLFYSTFVPKHEPVCNEDIEKIKSFLYNSNKILVLTGAGISTESGIPDYRSEGVGLYARSSSKPIQYHDFLRNAEIRKRYWARNYVGWPQFSSTIPNTTHYALQKLELEYDKINMIVTQNVDNLHYKAGSKKVIELHGSAFRVMCLQCDFHIDRHMFQMLLRDINPTMQTISHIFRPDGDVELSQDDVARFVVPPCPKCRGILKPDIVFFGDNVRKELVESVRKLVETSDAVLVLGSSLSVFSGYRFVLHAHEHNKPIAIINIGETRGDKFASLKIHKNCGEIFNQLYESF